MYYFGVQGEGADNEGENDAAAADAETNVARGYSYTDEAACDVNMGVFLDCIQVGG